MTPMKCQRNCPGTIDAGYCDTCGMAPERGAATPGASSAGAAPPRGAASTGAAPRTATTATQVSVLSTRTTGSARSGNSRTGSRRKMGAGLVEVAPLPQQDPAKAVMATPVVPEDKRYCAKCNNPVGRGRAGKPGRTAGFCPSCGDPFDFTPKLRPGDLVAGQYSVVGALAHGGLGWIYLATDKNVSDRWVVLKGLLNSGDEDAVAAAVAERRFLAQVTHPNIVEIYNFVEHNGAGYIVMEYVGGPSLKTILKDRRAANSNQTDPLPVATVLAYLLEVMPAFAYLHSRNLLFCDFKPDNVIQTEDEIKLIDLGAVIRADDENAAIYGTVGYQAPEIAELGPSVASDLYTIGRTLAVLTFDFRGYQSTFADSLPDACEVEVFRRYPSFHRLVQKACHPDRDARFASADEMAEQMLGVLREVLAADGTPKPAPSNLFTAEQRSDLRTDTPQWRHLPVPMMDLTDPSAAFLASITVTEPLEVLALLGTAPEQSIEVYLRAIRAQIEQGALAAADSADSAGGGTGPARTATGAKPFTGARTALAEATAMFGNEWRLAWYDGVLALAEGEYGRAQAQLDAVYDCLPGELAAKLALALAYELAGEYPTAATLYDTVSRTDPAYTTAHAGLARCRLAAGDRSGAVEAYNRVPGTSAAFRISQVAAVRALVNTTTGTHPDSAALTAAAAMIDRLEMTSAQLAALRAELLETALAALSTGRSVPGAVLGNGHDPTTPADERDVRFALEDSYRAIAKAHSGPERIRLVDLANSVRPRTRT
jgi:serine/threonine-protein kinase PknG